MRRRSSIAVRLFVLVFGFSVAWFTLETSVQMVLEYRNSRVDADANLADFYQASRSGLETALWSYDLTLARGILDSSRSVRFLSGARIVDDRGTPVASWGLGVSPGMTGESNVPALAEPLFHRFRLLHAAGPGQPLVVGTLELVSGFPVLAGRIGDRLGLIGINYVATTLGLMVILVFGLRSLVSRPLARITRAIGDYRFDRADLPPLGTGLGDDNELAVLWRSFEDLTASLKESYLQQRVMSAILEEAAVMALVCDADGLVVSSNAQARSRLSGAQPGGRLAHLAYGDDPAPLFEGTRSLLAGGLAWRGEVTARNSQGRTFWLSAALLPLEVPAEPRARWGVMIEDVSAKRLTDLYRQERDLAREAARAKSLFLANLSHEIRTPMNAVVGLTSLALGEEVSPRAREYLSQLEHSGAVLLGVINSILDYSKLEEGKVDLEVRNFPLQDLIRGIEALAGYRASEKGLAFSIQAVPGVPPVLWGDSLRLQQALLNLVVNAIKFTEAGGIEVTIRSLAPADGAVPLRFEVADTGIGIEPADQARLFRSFTQVDASTTRKYGGTGLGLAITRQLVHLMGGTVGLSSEPGKGSVFWFEVPLEVGQVPDPVLPRPTWDFHGRRVLLAEDNKVNQLVALEILKKARVDLEVVGDGCQAVDAVARGHFDLVLMDLQMPVLDGIEATKEIRRTRGAGELPIVAMTAHTFEHEREICLAAGMQDLVPKPVDPEVLYRTLSRWLGGGSTS
jgi:signal transduction histidine kinase